MNSRVRLYKYLDGVSYSNWQWTTQQLQELAYLACLMFQRSRSAMVPDSCRSYGGGAWEQELLDSSRCRNLPSTAPTRSVSESDLKCLDWTITVESADSNTCPSMSGKYFSIPAPNNTMRELSGYLSFKPSMNCLTLSSLWHPSKISVTSSRTKRSILHGQKKVFKPSVETFKNLKTAIARQAFWICTEYEVCNPKATTSSLNE